MGRRLAWGGPLVAFPEWNQQLTRSVMLRGNWGRETTRRPAWDYWLVADRYRRYAWLSEPSILMPHGMLSRVRRAKWRSSRRQRICRPLAMNQAGGKQRYRQLFGNSAGGTADWVYSPSVFGAVPGPRTGLDIWADFTPIPGGDRTFYEARSTWWREGEDPFIDIETMIDAYIGAMLWSSLDESDDGGGRPLYERFGKEDIAESAMVRIREEVTQFAREHAADILVWAGRPEEQAGHDLWFTRAGHGVGFWEPEWTNLPGNPGERLTAAAQALGEQWPYVGDDGKIYL